jgi:hypothetical protein
MEKENGGNTKTSFYFFDNVSPCLNKKMYLAGARIYYGKTEDKFGI